MNNYAIYYDYKKNNDRLIILFDTYKNSKNIKENENTILYFDNDKLNHIEIKNFSSFIKIKTVGLIPSLDKRFLSIINNILKNDKLDILEEKNNSGFVVGEVINKVKDNIYKVKIFNKEINCYSSFNNLEINNLFVILLNNEFDFKMNKLDSYKLDSLLIEGKICSLMDLNMEDNVDFDSAVCLESGYNLNDDFFEII